MYTTGVIERTDLRKRIIMNREKLQDYMYYIFTCVLLPYFKILFEEIIIQILPDAALLFIEYFDENDECAY